MPSSQSEFAPVLFVGAGPGDPDLLTLRAARALAAADIVLHDRLVGPGVLALAGPQATLIAVGKEGFGPSTPQTEITALILAFARAGRRVLRLKGGDCGIFGRLDEETGPLAEAGIGYEIVPGITASVAAAAAIGQSLTRRGRNTGLRILTGHDAEGFADQDWRALAQPGQVAAIYMGKKAARFVQGRLMMHGGDPATEVTVVENASLPGQRVLPTTLSALPACLEDVAGPAVILLGLAPRAAALALPELKEALS